MTIYYDERNDAIADILVGELDVPIQVLTSRFDSKTGVIHGHFLNDGNFYSYALNESAVGIKYHDQETQELNNYARGLLNGYGIKTDSLSPYEYTLGLLRMDAQVRCTKGGTPCGKICLPKGATCHKYGSGGGKLKSTKAAIGVVGGIVGAGLAGLAIAGTAGLVYSRIKSTPDKDKEKTKPAMKEAKNIVGEGLKSVSTDPKNAKEVINKNAVESSKETEEAIKSGVETTKQKVESVKQAFSWKDMNANSESDGLESKKAKRRRGTRWNIKQKN